MLVWYENFNSGFTIYTKRGIKLVGLYLLIFTFVKWEYYYVVL